MRNHLRELEEEKRRLSTRIQHMAAERPKRDRHDDELLERLEDRLARIDERLYREHTGVAF